MKLRPALAAIALFAAATGGVMAQTHHDSGQFSAATVAVQGGVASTGDIDASISLQLPLPPIGPLAGPPTCC